MTKTILKAGAAVALSLACASAMAEGTRYVVLMKNNAVPSDLATAVQRSGGTLVRTLPQIGIAIAESSSDRFAATIARDARVLSAGVVPAHALPEAIASPEAPTAADNLYNSGLLWGINRVNAPAAWAAGRTGTHDTVVAVIDTGIATNHPDLAPNVVFTACFSSLPTCNPYPSLSDHGTHVAGTVAAAFGAGRVVGVGPGLGLAGYNTFESIPGCGTCSYSDSRWAAMVDAADRGFEVINMSLGALGGYGGKGSQELATFVAADKRVVDYVLNRGTTIVASAGNSAVDLNGVLINLPGGLPGILNVAATGVQPAPRYPFPNSFDVQAFYSNQGASVDVAGPGGDCGQIGICDPATRPANWFEHLVLSTTVTANAVCAATQSCAVGYGWKGGTSMAAPHVAGVTGLVRDANPGLTARQAADLVKRTAQPLGNRQVFGHGMVNAAAAVEAATK